MGRILLKLILYLTVGAATLYAADFVIWKIRVLRGTGDGSLTVSRIVVAPLKGGKEEYYPDGTETVLCSHSLFPQTGSGACWWVARHRVSYDR